MNNFKDFDIKPKPQTFTGEKIKMKSILNVEIKVIDFKIGPSKLKAGGDCLTLQIQKGVDKRVVFCGSTILMDQIQRVPREKFPFTTTIRNDNEHYEFT